MTGQDKAPSREAHARSLGRTLLAFTATTFLSAMLLFSIQPMFAKMVLPLLGGSPSVWAVALVFFQTALLAGYCYAHALTRNVPANLSGWVHLGVCAVALIALPIGVPASWSEPPPGDPYLWQLGLFTVAVGLPFVAVSANAPLLQAWFARTGHAQAHDPYFLYAASNLGSFLALLGYPLVLEPSFGLSALARVWAVGFLVLAAALALCFLLAGQSRKAGSNGDEATLGADPQPVSWSDRLAWIGLALVPSALLTAFTNHVATDIASAPLIWVIPLALYLLTFVLVFRERSLIPPHILLAVHLLAVVAALVQLARLETDSVFLSGGLGVVAFFTSALVAHRTLYEARPAARHLTEFYLWMSFGGALGGLFAALLAPHIFSEIYEYPLLLAATLACRPKALEWAGLKIKDNPGFIALLVAGALAAWLLPWWAAQYDYPFGVWGATAVVVLALGAAVFASWKNPSRQIVLGLLMALAVVTQPSSVHRGAAERSFFGVYRVIQSEDRVYNLLQHGTTLHGAQRVRDDKGNPVNDTQPVTYYHPLGPMASSVRWARGRLPDEEKPGKFAVIGLGAGSLACHSQPGETWTFYEIDPIVQKIAQSDKFTYLKTCLPNANIVIGDARLTIAKEKDESLDLLIVDAFSSDAVPMHLLTAEALKLYASKLKPDAVAALHISNRYLDLEGVLQATIESVPDLRALAIEDMNPNNGYAVTRSTVIVMGKNPHIVMRMLGSKGSRTLFYRGLSPWTDDTSDILGPLVSRYRNPR